MNPFIQYKKIDRHPAGYKVVIVAAPGVTVGMTVCSTVEEARIYANKTIPLPWERHIPSLEKSFSEIKL